VDNCKVLTRARISPHATPLPHNQVVVAKASSL